MAELEFLQVETDEERAEAEALIREYLRALDDRVRRDYGIEFDVEGMVRSDVDDRRKFRPPHGRFYLVRLGGRTAGVGGLKKLEEGVGELQRMYVPPAFRSRGIGRAIAERLIDDARSIGYSRLVLESLEFLEAAHSLYRSLGFTETRPYEQNSMQSHQAAEQLDRYYAITVFMQLDLTC